MFQSIEYLGYSQKTECYLHEYEITDSDFGCVVVVVEIEAGMNAEREGEDDIGADVDVEEEIEAVIQEYSKRNLNVAANLLLYFRWYEKKYGDSIADQIERADKYQPFFTPELKEQIEKYMVLL